MKKLLVTASTFPRWQDDTEPKFIYDLCKEYAKYYDVTVLVPSTYGALNKEEMEGLHVIRYRYFPIKKLETLAYPGAIVPRIKEKKSRALLVPFMFIAMYFAIRKEMKKVDAVHSNWLIPQGIIQQFFKKPFVLTGLGGDVTSLNKGFIKKMKMRTLLKASAVTVVSKDLKEHLEKEYRYEKAEVIPMGVDLTKFSPKYRQDNFFETNGKPVILFVGRLAEKKGAKYLIRAMAKIDAVLIIVGDGPEKEVLMQEANHVQADIRFVGSKNKDELAVINASCDIFCVPSVVAKDGDKDGLPVALIEAMASGVPVVASDVGGINEAVEDNVNGFLVEPSDVQELESKLNELLSERNRRLDMGKKARLKAEEFDFIEIGKKYKQIFDNLS
ncbi:glycosyltransferase [Enterococcus ureilyticus]|uniref:glycosyltransferase n=1 Tax=Enterococcus ureilyticus TaxID=1131292 RepID=UPI001A91D607|nr:glycosyltransferase [Enterococcus ureilyticus]MBO0445517.1 glycosyltransferase [Enterococcus ureilyticus]